MSSTYTTSETSTYTEARARYVLQKAWDDLIGLMCLEHISRENANKWYREIKHLLDLEALKSFEIKVKNQGSTIMAWRYDVLANGSIYEDSESGGIDLSDIPAGSSCAIVVDLTNDAGNKQAALDFLHQNGWRNGSFTTGTFQSDRAFSKDGYGLKRSIYKENT